MSEPLWNDERIAETIFDATREEDGYTAHPSPMSIMHKIIDSYEEERERLLARIAELEQETRGLRASIEMRNQPYNPDAQLRAFNRIFRGEP